MVSSLGPSLKPYTLKYSDVALSAQDSCWSGVRAHSALLKVPSTHQVVPTLRAVLDTEQVTVLGPSARVACVQLAARVTNTQQQGSARCDSLRNGGGGIFQLDTFAAEPYP